MRVKMCSGLWSGRGGRGNLLVARKVLFLPFVKSEILGIKSLVVLVNSLGFKGLCVRRGCSAHRDSQRTESDVAFLNRNLVPIL